MSPWPADKTLQLCQVPSVIGDEKALCDQLERWCQARFDTVRRISHSLVAGRFDDARPTLALVGHLDTVPVHPEDGPARRENDRVYGLGASDMKGGIAVAMELLETLDRAPLPYNLALILYEREEGPYEHNGLGPVLEQLPELKRIALAVCMEPTDNEIQVGCVGGLHATVTFRGRSAHSARPWQGENAIHKAGELLTELHHRERTRVEVEGFEYFEVISATLAKAGRARNVIPESFELNLNYRFAPGKSLETAEQELRAFIGDRADVTIIDRSPSGRVCAENPLYQRFVQSTGAKLTSKQVWTDVARFSAAGIDAVNFGPGLTAQAHQKNEYVPVDMLVQSYEMLRRFLAG
ncbi:MAG: succinyl-diaminopimelate desuccinylase [Myxococcales bacterium]